MKSGSYILAAVLLGGAGAYLMFSANKGLGIFFVLMAAVLSRVLVLNVPEMLEGSGDDQDVEPSN